MDGLWLWKKKSEMWKCGVITSALMEVLEKHVFWLALEFLFALGIQLVYTDIDIELDLLSYREIQVHCRIRFQNTIH